jgi:probable HAF family extracellular repeat protein
MHDCITKYEPIATAASASPRTFSRLTAALVIWTLAQVPSAALAQSFQWLGFLEGGTYSEAFAVSGDGRVIVGTAGNANDRPRAFRYTAEEGMQDLGVLPGWTESHAYGVNYDGSVVVGICGDPLSSDEKVAFRWTVDEGEMVSLGTLPGGTWSIAYDVSADGSVIVGSSDSADGDRAFRWMEAGGMQSIGVIEGGLRTYGGGVSADGAVVTGFGYPECGRSTFQWTALDGVQTPPRDCDTHSSGLRVSADGSTVVGYFAEPPFYLYSKPYRWRVGYEPVELAMLAGDWNSIAHDVNVDGSVVVGFGQPSNGTRAVFWNKNLGAVELLAHLQMLQVFTPAQTLEYAHGVSDNGDVIVGTNGQGWPTEAWVATIPAFCRADYNGDGSAEVDDIFTFLGLWFANDQRADVEDNGDIAVPDIFAFLSAWFSGCQ